MKRALLTGAGAAVVLLVSCAAKWVEPYSWTLRQDGHLRASQRKEDFTFEQWAAKYMPNVKNAYGVVVTPEGAAEIARELKRREAKIIELQNKISNGCN